MKWYGKKVSWKLLQIDEELEMFLKTCEFYGGACHFAMKRRAYPVFKSFHVIRISRINLIVISQIILIFISQMVYETMKWPFAKSTSFKFWVNFWYFTETKKAITLSCVKEYAPLNVVLSRKCRRRKKCMRNQHMPYSQTIGNPNRQKNIITQHVPNIITKPYILVFILL